MLNCLCKKEVMSISEFLEIEEIGNLKQIEMLAGRILKSKTLKTVAMVTITIILNINTVGAAGVGIDALGNMLINLIRGYAYYILIIMSIVESIRAAVSGDSKKVLSIVMRYLLVFIMMYLIPQIFDSIRRQL